jgi:site-specific DNA-methyltransferase (adenine-specific)
MNIQLIHGDCTVEHSNIKDGSVDLILTDLPYGTMNGARLDGWELSKTSWDYAIEPSKIYEIANKILRKNGKMILFSQEPYTTNLTSNAINNLPVSYRMIWEKDHFANALLAKKAPVSYFEDIIVYNKLYEFECLHPLREYFKRVLQFIAKPKKFILNIIGQKADHVLRFSSSQFGLCTEETYNAFIDIFAIHNMNGFMSFSELCEIHENFGYKSTFNLWDGKKYKSNILKYKKDYQGLHPTQKPVLLLEDLIKTFSNPNDLVVDLTMGSGSTGVAALNTNRNFIGIELNDQYFSIAKKRISEKTSNKIELF